MCAIFSAIFLYDKCAIYVVFDVCVCALCGIFFVRTCECARLSAFFFIFPHVYMCWPNKTPFIRYIRAHLQEKPYHVLWRNERKAERYEYEDAFYFLSHFFNQYRFNIVSNLQDMSVASHAQNSHWGTEKHPYFYFDGEKDFVTLQK